MPSVVQGLLPQSITRQSECSPLPVPEREGEHALSSYEGRLQPPAIESCQQRFGIGIPAPGVRRLRLRDESANLQVVVDLAVEDDHEPARHRNHRLPARGREVENREAPMPERDARGWITPDSRVIGSTMG